MCVAAVAVRGGGGKRREAQQEAEERALASTFSSSKYSQLAPDLTMDT